MAVFALIPILFVTAIVLDMAISSSWHTCRMMIGSCCGAFFLMVVSQLTATDIYPYSNSNENWFLYKMVTGAVLGAATGIAVFLSEEAKRFGFGIASNLFGIGSVLTLTSVVVGCDYSDDPLSQAVFALFWSALLFLRGLWLIWLGTVATLRNREDRL